MSRMSDCFVSAVVPLRDEAAHLEAFLGRLHAILVEHYENYEVVLIDDGSTDGTALLMDDLLRRHEGVRYVRLSRRFGTEIAITAGLEMAIGDYMVVVMPESDPVESIPAMVSLARSRTCIVVGRMRNPRHSLAQRMARRVFHRLFPGIPRHTTYFIVASRQVVNSVNQIKDKFRYIKSLAVYTGFPIELFDYDAVDGGQRLTGRSFWKDLNMAIDLIVSSSTRPLRVVSLLGLGVSGINLLYMGYIVAIYFFKKHVAEGWVTLSTQNAVAFFVLNVVLATVCEYLGRVLVETQERPFYFVRDERCSLVAVPNQERRNIATTSSVPQ